MIQCFGDPEFCGEAISREISLAGISQTAGRLVLGVKEELAYSLNLELTPQFSLLVGSALGKSVATGRWEATVFQVVLESDLNNE